VEDREEKKSCSLSVLILFLLKHHVARWQRWEGQGKMVVNERES
jgi:hypothetical protein